MLRLVGEAWWHAEERWRLVSVVGSGYVGGIVMRFWAT